MLNVWLKIVTMCDDSVQTDVPKGSLARPGHIIPPFPFAANAGRIANLSDNLRPTYLKLLTTASRIVLFKM